MIIVNNEEKMENKDIARQLKYILVESDELVRDAVEILEDLYASELTMSE